MQFFISLLLVVAVVAHADGVLQMPETTSAPAVEPRDLVSDISHFTSGIAALPSILHSSETSRLDDFSSGLSTLTASAASVSSSLGLQLSTADAAASTSIHSQLSQVAANVSSASAALRAAQSAVNSTSTSSSATASSSTVHGAGCAQTAAVGMGALVGGIAVLAQL